MARPRARLGPHHILTEHRRQTRGALSLSPTVLEVRAELGVKLAGSVLMTFTFSIPFTPRSRGSVFIMVRSPTGNTFYSKIEPSDKTRVIANVIMKYHYYKRWVAKAQILHSIGGI